MLNYSSLDRKLNLSFGSIKTGKLFMNIVDLNGKSVYSSNLGFSNIGQNDIKVSIDNDFNSGVYIVNMFIDNLPFSKKIFIN